MTAERPITIAARAACEALTRALDTERRAADEVEARGGERSARMALDSDRAAASAAIRNLGKACSRAGCGRGILQDLAERAEGALHGFARQTWCLKIMAIAAEAVADTEAQP